MVKRFGAALLGALLVLAGGLTASNIQTTGGIEMRDIRIPIGEGKHLAAYLYVPEGAAAATPAPGILAVHGYINSRETQSPFAIELARRGYVVLALDQSGHGFSTNLAFEEGFGGPAALAYLRALPFVDPARIGLEGHSMGGWTSLAAADTLPDAYRSIALVGSSTGWRYPREGTPDWPRNTAVIFSLFDEFSQPMWNAEKASEVAASPKLQTMFGTDERVEVGRLYGSLEDGTARILTQPHASHAGDHLSQGAVGDVIDWMETTLGAPTPKPRGDQIWMWKEGGTLLALLGGAVLLFGLMAAGPARGAVPAPAASSAGRWWLALALGLIVPAVTFFPATRLGAALGSVEFLKQNITTQIMTWALVNAAIALVTLFFAPRVAVERPKALVVLGGIVAGLVGVAALYGAVAASDSLFQTDLRFWVVALKPLGDHHLEQALIYLAPFTVFFVLSHWALEASLLRSATGAFGQYITGWLASAGGMAILIGFAYAYLFTQGTLPPGFDPLFTIIAIQFVPVLSLTGLLAVAAWRQTGSTLPGALASGALVTWYIVAGQATHG